MHPVALILFRLPIQDDVLPLSKPFVNLHGEMVTELPIPKGLRILTSISGYNRNKDIFGNDANTFDPSRWLESRIKATTPVGVIGNLLSFSAGARSCIGWRFAVAELQTFLVEFVSKFEFSMTPDAEKIKREVAVIMVPVIEGQVEKGARLPLRVKYASREVVF